MNSFGSNEESSNQNSVLIGQDRNCTAIDKSTRTLCGETESLRILDEFQKLYEARIEKVDGEIEGEFERVSTKLKIMREWIKDLGEQNIMLVHTVEDLEETACSRVKLLQEKLQQSSTIVAKNMSRSSHTEEAINTLTTRVNELEKDEEYMQQKIEFLQSDIRGLLELIRRAIHENNWNLEGIKFYEIQPKDIPAFDCTCNQETTDNENIQSLKLKVEQLQTNEKEMIEYQKELEEKLTNLTMKLFTKENTIKKYVSQLQNFNNNHKKHGKTGDHDIYHPLDTGDEQQCPDETNALQKLCTDTSAFQEDQILLYLSRTKSLMEKEKEALFSLKVELQKILEKLHCTEEEGNEYNMIDICQKLQDLENLLKNYKTEVSDYPEYAEDLRNCISTIELQTKHLQEIFQNEFVECYTDKDKSDINAIISTLTTNLEYITKMCAEKENVIATIQSMVNVENNNCICNETMATPSNIDVDQEVKLLEMYISRYLAAKTSREPIKQYKQKISELASTFFSRHQKYSTLNNKVFDIQDQLKKIREKILETINKLQLQTKERERHSERIVCGNVKLKDIKNEINQSQSRLSSRIINMQDNVQEQAMSGYTEMSICSDLLSLVMEEIEEISHNLHTFQTQGCCITSILEELKAQVFDVDSSVKELRKKMEEALSEDAAAEVTFLEEEHQLEQLEVEVNTLHTKMQHVFEALLSMNVQNQSMNEILQTAQNLYGLKHGYDDLKPKLSEKISYAECNERMCQWKCLVIDLKNEVSVLQHEVKRKQEANDFLKKSIASLEEKLHSAQAETESHRKSCSVERMKLQKKIIELESTLKTQKETECTLRQHLSENETELKKSKELLNSLHTEYGVEGILLHCGCNQFRHETMSVPQLFKTLQNAMQSAKSGLQDMKIDLKNLLCEGSSDSCSSTKSIISLIDKLQKYEEGLDNCTQEIDKLKNALYSKEKLLENMDEIIRIQKDSIVMTQAELKELHQKLQEKIDNQDQVISQYEKEKKELLKQNDLQIQTIGHLQNAVVEAKRCIDQMGHKSMNDVSELWPAISSPTCSHGNVHDV